MKTTMLARPRPARPARSARSARGAAATLALALSLSLALTACSGGDDNAEETEAWARQVCGEMRPHVKQIQTANAAITEASESDAGPKEIQETDSAAFQDISDAYGGLAETVQNAGEPPVDDGERLRRNAVTELNGLSDAYGELKETVDGLDTSDRGEFAEGLGGVAERLGELGESGDRAVADLQEGELGEAMAEQPGCRTLSASPAPPDAGDESPSGEGGGN